jgi:T-complex protein 1 subunit gamma
MKEYGVWEPQAVKAQTIKTAIESACLLLRVDDIVSGVSRKQQGGAGPTQQQGETPEEGGVSFLFLIFEVWNVGLYIFFLGPP